MNRKNIKKVYQSRSSQRTETTLSFVKSCHLGEIESRWRVPGKTWDQKGNVTSFGVTFKVESVGETLGFSLPPILQSPNSNSH